jgi:hypothetical protein
MPTQKLRLTKTEDQEYRHSLSMLEGMGIPIGYAVDPPHEPDRITLEQTGYELARIYELPLDEVVVVVPAKMTILKSGILITHVAMITPWEDCPLELCDPEETSYYGKLIGGFCHFQPAVLNTWLTKKISLRPRQVEGLIIAHGYTSVPRECHEETLVKAELLLTDERRKTLSFDFGVQLNRSVMRKCEKQRQKERRALAQSPEERGLFAPQPGQPGDQKSVSPEKPSSSSNLPRSNTQSRTQGTWNPTKIDLMTGQILARGDDGFITDTPYV